MPRPYLAIAILLPALAAGAWAQRPPRGGGGGEGPGRKGPPPMSRGDRTPLDRWKRMSPQERERVLKQLPPDRERRVREQLENFNRMPESERDRLTLRYERFSELPPEKQDLVRRHLRRFGNYPEERRKVLAMEFRSLRDMPEDERRARLDSEEFRSRYTAQERQMLQDLAENLPPAAAPRVDPDTEPQP